MSKTILGRYGNNRGHWVGDGFPGSLAVSYDSRAQHISPFLLLDYAGPHDFEPTTQRRGVGQHPHRGFETVTIVYDGEVEHRDSAGNGGVIGPGDVQWMTAGGRHPARGISFAGLRETRRPVPHGAALGQPAGEGQDGAGRAIRRILDADIPVVDLAGDAGKGA